MNDRHSTSQPAGGIGRRDLLLGMGAAAAATFAGKAGAVMTGHDHSQHKVQHGDLLDATFGCVDAGQRCIAHCLVAFQEGDVELAECAAKVHEMQAICSGFTYLLAANSDYAQQYAAICAEVCKDCEEECRKHEQHFECKACATACGLVVDKIKRTFG